MSPRTDLIGEVRQLLDGCHEYSRGILEDFANKHNVSRDDLIYQFLNVSAMIRFENLRSADIVGPMFDHVFAVPEYWPYLLDIIRSSFPDHVRSFAKTFNTDKPDAMHHICFVNDSFDFVFEEHVQKMYEGTSSQFTEVDRFYTCLSLIFLKPSLKEYFLGPLNRSFKQLTIGELESMDQSLCRSYLEVFLFDETFLNCDGFDLTAIMGMINNYFVYTSVGRCEKTRKMRDFERPYRVFLPTIMELIQVCISSTTNEPLKESIMEFGEEGVRSVLPLSHFLMSNVNIDVPMSIERAALSITLTANYLHYQIEDTRGPCMGFAAVNKYWSDGHVAEKDLHGFAAAYKPLSLAYEELLLKGSDETIDEVIRRAGGCAAACTVAQITQFNQHHEATVKMCDQTTICEETTNEAEILNQMKILFMHAASCRGLGYMEATISYSLRLLQILPEDWDTCRQVKDEGVVPIRMWGIRFMVYNFLNDALYSLAVDKDNRICALLALVSSSFCLTDHCMRFGGAFINKVSSDPKLMRCMLAYCYACVRPLKHISGLCKIVPELDYHFLSEMCYENLKFAKLTPMQKWKMGHLFYKNLDQLIEKACQSASPADCLSSVAPITDQSIEKIREFCGLMTWEEHNLAISERKRAAAMEESHPRKSKGFEQHYRDSLRESRIKKLRAMQAADPTIQDVVYDSDEEEQKIIDRHNFCRFKTPRQIALHDKIEEAKSKNPFWQEVCRLIEVAGVHLARMAAEKQLEEEEEEYNEPEVEHMDNAMDGGNYTMESYSEDANGKIENVYVTDSSDNDAFVMSASDDSNQ